MWTTLEFRGSFGIRNELLGHRWFARVVKFFWLHKARRSTQCNSNKKQVQKKKLMKCSKNLNAFKEPTFFQINLNRFLWKIMLTVKLSSTGQFFLLLFLAQKKWKWLETANFNKTNCVFVVVVFIYGDFSLIYPLIIFAHSIILNKKTEIVNVQSLNRTKFDYNIQLQKESSWKFSSYIKRG